MRPILFLVAALAASTAMASVKLPVSGTYGTGNACALYKAGGTNAVVSGGGSIGLADTADNSMLVSPDEILGLEWGCQATIVTGNTALLACSGEGDGAVRI